MKTIYTGLVGDIGGTNARLAVVDTTGRIRNPKTYPAAEYGSLTEVISEYLETTVGRQKVHTAAIAVAGPVVDGEIEFTNLDWRVSEGELIGTFEFHSARLINDFAAQALAAPVLDPDDLKTIGPAIRGAEGAPILVLGAGTGFGVSMVVRTDRGDIAVPCEGGHAGFAPYDGVEAAIWASLRRTYGRVSIERILSGPGLYALYRGLADVRGVPAELRDEKEVLAAGQKGGDLLAEETLDRFCEILGSVAGDIALTCGARGGVYVSGGIAPRLADRLASGGFRRRFEDKGRLSDYTRDIPTYLIVHPYAALVGAARVLEQLEGNPL
ncbi:glucokinase [Phenylobacterium sp. 58.2.17]|uniref:glucokinase n=1 Tax=Phenylobacterium sp. 58.2.17 TaxID=2969306 RepID=UPI00226565FB|nr:glucokinase [Phenylobacterium sp. 58.2.17]MCX7586629.1 glucokinase [Phenylobacterium sp. 58.2.17]